MWCMHAVLRRHIFRTKPGEEEMTRVGRGPLFPTRRAAPLRTKDCSEGQRLPAVTQHPAAKWGKIHPSWVKSVGQGNPGMVRGCSAWGCSAQPRSEDRAGPGTVQGLRISGTGRELRDRVGVASPGEISLLPGAGQGMPSPAVALCTVPMALRAGRIPASCTGWERWARLWQQQQILLVTASSGALTITGWGCGVC